TGLVYATALHLLSFFTLTVSGLVFYLYWTYKRRHSGKPTVEKEENISKNLTILFEKPNNFNEVKKAVFVFSQELRSPMGSNTAAFENKAAAEKFMKGKQGEILNWQQVYDKLK
ncbi:MAG TPA: nitrous oxide reductase accessory protein NosL, partial [Chitinophagaceae bacterium]|nr:nitrous oxide reductase accessory protein NosL [Chitinophagaceae bacterium]